MASKAVEKFVAKWDEISGARMEKGHNFYSSSFFLVGKRDMIFSYLGGNDKVEFEDPVHNLKSVVKNRKLQLVKSVKKSYSYKHDKSRLNKLGKDGAYCLKFDNIAFTEEWTEDLLSMIGAVDKIEHWKLEGDFDLPKSGGVFHDVIHLLVFVDSEGDCAGVTNYDNDKESNKKRLEIDGLCDEEFTMKDEHGNTVEIELEEPIIVEDIEEASTATFDALAW